MKATAFICSQESQNSCKVLPGRSCLWEPLEVNVTGMLVFHFPLGRRACWLRSSSLRQLLESSVTSCGATHLEGVAPVLRGLRRMTRKVSMRSPSRKRCDECLHFIASIHCFFCILVRHSALTVTQTQF